MDEPESEAEPEAQWEIEDGNDPMMKWILNKGYGIGKKMAMTGIAISVPLVLPPIVAMGIAFSIPSGFVFATYACTNKLMTTLLPIPPSPLVLEYYTDENEDEKANDEGIESRPELNDIINNGYRQMDEMVNSYVDGVGAENVMQEEDGEGSRVIDQQVEETQRDILQTQTVVEDDEGRGQIEGVEMNTSVDEQGSEEDVGEYLEEDDDSLREKSLLEPKLDTREGDDDSLEEEYKREEPLLETRLDENENLITQDNKEEIVEGVLKKLRDQGRVDVNTSEDDDSISIVNTIETTESIAVIEDNTAEGDYFLDKTTSNIIPEDAETTEPVTVYEGSVEDNTIEDLDESDSSVALKDAETTEAVIVREMETEKLVKDGTKPIGEMSHVVILSPGNEDNNFNSRQVEELDLVARQVVRETDQDGRNTESDEEVLRASMGSQEETGSDVRDEGTEATSLIHANLDVRNDETGLDLLDDRNTEGLEAGDEVKGSVVENVDVLELPAFGRVPLDTDNAEVTSMTNTKTSSREDTLNGKLVLENIGENRAIEYNREESLLNSRLDEDKGKEPLLESRLDEDIVKGSTGLLRNIRDKGRVNDDTIETDYSSVSNVVSDEVKEDETIEPITVKEIETQILVKDGSNNHETIGEMHHAVLISAGNEQNNFDSRGVAEVDLVSREVVVDFDKDGRDTEYDDKVIRGSMGTHEKTGSGISDQGTEDASLRTKKDHLIHTNTNVREMGDESGLDLFDDQKASVKFESREDGGSLKELLADENVDVSALPAFRRVSLDTENGTVTSETHAKTASREDVLDDEKIWEKIIAMRTIVGYNTPRQPTCIGELKALYVFTGVEPPASSEGDKDLDEVNANLRFLMAIVGVK